MEVAEWARRGERGGRRRHHVGLCADLAEDPRLWTLFPNQVSLSLSLSIPHRLCSS